MPELSILELILSTFFYGMIHLFYPITVTVHPFIFSHQLVTGNKKIYIFLVDRYFPYLLALFFSYIKSMLINYGILT